MKFLPLAAALMTVSLMGGAAHAKAFQCIDGKLVGGPEGFSCRVDSAGKIVDVERRVDRGTSYIASGKSAGGYSYNDTYTRKQTYTSTRKQTYTSPTITTRTTTRIVRYSGKSEAASPRVTRTYSYAEPAYTSGAPAAEVHNVRVYRGGTPGATRPCSYYSQGTSITTFSGCPYAHGSRASHRTTMYLGPNPQRPELGGSAHYVEAGGTYDYVPVIGVNSGVCNHKISRLGDDEQGRTRYDVCYADLQPVYGGRVEKLYDRLETAAKRACSYSSSIAQVARRSDCRKQAVEMAVYETGLQSLVNYHLAKTGGRPRVVVGPLRRY